MKVTVHPRPAGPRTGAQRVPWQDGQRPWSRTVARALLAATVLGACQYKRVLPPVLDDAGPAGVPGDAGKADTGRTGAVPDAGTRPSDGNNRAPDARAPEADGSGPAADAQVPSPADAPPTDASAACDPGLRLPCYGGPPTTAGVGACHAGERVCLLGVWSACTGEQQPAPERCNGADDDCDGVTDDGCPVDGAMLSAGLRRPAGPVLGTLTLPRAVTFSDPCPDGQAAIAFSGNYGSGIDSIGVRCGKLQVRADRSVQPYRYELQIVPGQEFSPRGGTGGIVNGVDRNMTCPLDEVVVGLSAWLDPVAPATCPDNYCPFTGILCASVYGLTVSCAAHELTGSPGSFRLARKGAPHTVAARIGVVNGVGEVENPYACPGQSILQQVNGAFGVWPLDCSSTVVNGLQLTCSDPGVPLIDGR